MNFPTSRTLKSTAVLSTATGLMALGAGAASAHVSVDPASTSAGGFSQLTFKVPNESGTAKTTKLTVTLPAGTPFTSVSVKPMDGWTAKVTADNTFGIAGLAAGLLGLAAGTAALIRTRAPRKN